MAWSLVLTWCGGLFRRAEELKLEPRRAGGPSRFDRSVATVATRTDISQSGVPDAQWPAPVVTSLAYHPDEQSGHGLVANLRPHIHTVAMEFPVSPMFVFRLPLFLLGRRLQRCF